MDKDALFNSNKFKLLGNLKLLKNHFLKCIIHFTSKKKRLLEMLQWLFKFQNIKGRYLDLNLELLEPQSSTLPIELYLPYI